MTADGLDLPSFMERKKNEKDGAVYDFKLVLQCRIDTAPQRRSRGRVLFVKRSIISKDARSWPWSWSCMAALSFSQGIGTTRADLADRLPLRRTTWAQDSILSPYVIFIISIRFHSRSSQFFFSISLGIPYQLQRAWSVSRPCLLVSSHCRDTLNRG